MSKSYHIETYGCQMNVADSELVSAMLQKAGYKETSEINEADAIFVNTCAIREHAEDKVHSRLGFYNKIKEQNLSHPLIIETHAFTPSFLLGNILS